MNFLSTFINVIIIVVLAVPGFCLKKARLLPEKATSTLAVLLLYVAQPFLMMSSILEGEFSASQLPDFAAVFVFAILLQLIVFFAAKPVFARVKEDSSRRVCIACSYLGNVGFMGIPVMQMLFPGREDLVLYTVVYNIVFVAMSWTLGVYIVTGDKKTVNPLKIILNPPTLASLAALPFFFLKVNVPQQVLTPIGYLGDMTLPLSMVILGIRLADVKLSSLFTDLKIYGVAAMKLVISPLIALGMMMLVDLVLPLDRYVMIALFVISAMPTASVVLSFAEMYDKDGATAARATLMNTLLCIVTIPILMLLCEFI